MAGIIQQEKAGELPVKGKDTHTGRVQPESTHFHERQVKSLAENGQEKEVVADDYYFPFGMLADDALDSTPGSLLYLS